MATELHPREGRAPDEFLLRPLSTLQSDVKFGDASLTDFVQYLETGKVIRQTIDGVERPYDSVATHWRALIPARRNMDALSSIGFDRQGFERASFDVFEPPTADQAAINSDLHTQGWTHPDVATRYASYIGDISRRVSLAGVPVFAAIVRRHAIGSADNPRLGWSEVVFSRWLLKTCDLMQADARVMKECGQQIPNWMTDASNPYFKHRTAFRLAVVALTRDCAGD